MDPVKVVLVEDDEDDYSYVIYPPDGSEYTKLLNGNITSSTRAMACVLPLVSAAGAAQ